MNRLPAWMTSSSRRSTTTTSPLHAADPRSCSTNSSLCSWYSCDPLGDVGQGEDLLDRVRCRMHASISCIISW